MHLLVSGLYRNCGFQYFLIFSHQLNKTLETDPVPTVQEVGWVLRPVWTGVENLTPPPEFDPRTVQRLAILYTD